MDRSRRRGAEGVRESGHGAAGNGYLVVRPGKADGFWTTIVFRYELYRWNGPDSLDYVLLRDTPWFPSMASDAPFPSRKERERQFYPPLFNHPVKDAHGWAWTCSRVPDQDWEPGIPPTRRTSGPPGPSTP